ncbi:MAG: TolC family protein [Deltaproteobacteria bacterium]|nr:TolC family protein [Deltaproteobacteria bacterium]
MMPLRGAAAALVLLSVPLAAAARPAKPTSGPGLAEATEQRKPAATEVERPEMAAVVLRDVLAATLKHHPTLRAAHAKVRARQAKLLAAQGAFDPKLMVDAGAAPIGPYGAWVAGLGVKQQTAWSGLAWKGGYRIGADHPVYAGKAVTAEAGEIYAQIEVPLLRGRAVDPERAKRRQAELEAEAEGLRLRSKALQLVEKAGLVWVKWRVAAAKERAYAELLSLAERRAAQLEVRVARGLVAELVRVDNARLLAARRERQLAARQATTTAALQLSLYYRDGQGAPREVASMASALGASPALEVRDDLGAQASRDEIEAAVAARPEPRVAGLAVASAQIDASLAANDAQPRANLLLDAAWGLGDDRGYGAAEISKGGPRAVAKLSLDWPWPRRKARGGRAAAEAAADAARAAGQLWRERIAVEVRSAHIALVAARKRMEQAQRAAEAAHALEQAEWRRFDLGQSDLVVVNLREVATADAAAKAAAAWGDLQAARLRLMAANGRLLPWLAPEPKPPAEAQSDAGAAPAAED